MPKQQLQPVPPPLSHGLLSPAEEGQRARARTREVQPPPLTLRCKTDPPSARAARTRPPTSHRTTRADGARFWKCFRGARGELYMMPLGAIGVSALGRLPWRWEGPEVRSSEIYPERRRGASTSALASLVSEDM